MSNKVRVAKRLVKNFFISWKHDGAKVTYQRVISTFKYGPQDPPIAEIMEDKIQSYDEGVYEGYVKSIEENNISRFNGGRMIQKLLHGICHSIIRLTLIINIMGRDLQNGQIHHRRFLYLQNTLSRISHTMWDIMIC